MDNEFSKQIEVLQVNISKTINEMKAQGYSFITVLSSLTTPSTGPDAHGVSYGGESFSTLLFHSKQKLCNLQKTLGITNFIKQHLTKKQTKTFATISGHPCLQ